MLDPIHLTAFVASRICHDLISPIGAIGNGVELMIMDASGNTGQETALILESAVNANARIRYFRVAFGQCGQDQRIARNEVMSILADIGAGSRISTHWESAADLARRDVKLTFLALMCLESALIHGGDIHICLSDQGWVLTATAARIRADGPLWQALSNPSDDCFDTIDAGHIHFAIFQMEAARQHRRIQVAGSEAEGTLTLRY